ncbi:MAG: Hsp20/alpha crystallin family protein [Gammaproteobacteria bacterium]|nr:Hsp20/alpha crystallin family protein [Gammaproteobacteria bacterium]
MNTIVKRPERLSAWDLFGDLDRFFDGFVGTPRQLEATGSAIVPAIDVTESESEYHVKAELPGVSKDDLDVSIRDGMLIINAETKHEHEEKKEGRIIRQERRYGKIVRSMRLGDDVDTANVKADYKDGVLSLVLPKVENVQPKKIEVQVA